MNAEFPKRAKMMYYYTLNNDYISEALPLIESFDLKLSKNRKC